ncbi:putative cytokinetic ring protein SteA [Schaalia sp. lx-100]|uniref:putative cytokinetic ring protein SteA n=1 Tax=Schaalia sp. lx-100 TaxID=2899081 RepID=UPI001E360D42|nr:putative cytokinetic ring protein SteA [Schaalia sp. lx-100]MCD4556922.1 thiamine pyrophosphokinase [Schaalia sp. lx-100]
MSATDRTGRNEQLLAGRVRVDEKTRALAARLEPGDIAVIDHPDLDRSTADALLAARPQAVLNAAPCVTGRHQVLGARILTQAGIIVIDDLGPDVMTLREGDEITVDHNGHVQCDGLTIATGTLRTHTSFNDDMDQTDRVNTQLLSFVASVENYLAQDGDILFRGHGIPQSQIDIHGKPVLLISDSQETPAELKALKKWIRDTDPVVVVVDAGAKHARRAHLKPRIVIGDMDTVPEKILRSGAQLLVRQGHDGIAPGRERLARMGVAHDVIEFGGSAQDAAVLFLSYAKPTVIVTVGQHHSVEDLIDRGRGAMAPTFFTRLVAQDLIVSSRAVAAMHRPRLRATSIVLLACVVVCTMGAALMTTPWGQDMAAVLGHYFSHLFGWSSPSSLTPTN